MVLLLPSLIFLWLFLHLIEQAKVQMFFSKTVNLCLKMWGKADYLLKRKRKRGNALHRIYGIPSLVSYITRISN